MCNALRLGAARALLMRHLLLSCAASTGLPGYPASFPAPPCPSPPRARLPPPLPSPSPPTSFLPRRCPALPLPGQAPLRTPAGRLCWRCSSTPHAQRSCEGRGRPSSRSHSGQTVLRCCVITASTAREGGVCGVIEGAQTVGTVDGERCASGGSCMRPCGTGHACMQHQCTMTAGTWS